MAKGLGVPGLPCFWEGENGHRVRMTNRGEREGITGNALGAQTHCGDKWYCIVLWDGGTQPVIERSDNLELIT